MCADQSDSEEHLRYEIPVTNCIDAIGRKGAEAETALQQHARYRICRTRNRTGSQRKHSSRSSHGSESGAVALKRPEMRKHPVSRAYRLSTLQVCVGRHQIPLERYSLIDHYL